MFSQHVIFGEKHPNATSNSIYFDKDGMIYPDVTISNEALLKCRSSLVQWYSQHPRFTDSLLHLYQLPSKKGAIETDGSLDTNNWYSFETLHNLNDVLIRKKSEQLDSIANGNGLEFYIHGYRKSYLENGRDVTSVAEFGYLKSSLDSTRTRKNLVVYVYWDGMYDCCFSSNFKKNKQLFKLFQTAGGNANLVSLSFTKLLENSTSKNINIVAHSLGTKIAVQGVMDCRNFNPVFNVCLIAPAIPASLIKDAYFDHLELPNCNWLILYNEKDFVLKKKDNKVGVFGPGAYKYGVTTLGCNKRNDAKKLDNWMNDTKPTVSFELVDKTYLGKCHSLRCYTKNQNLIEVSSFFESR